MTEYFKFEIERTEDPDVMEIYTNQALTEGPDEVYESLEAGETGSPIAQTLFVGVDGIQALTLSEDMLIIRREPHVPWEMLVDEVRDVLRDFFL